MSFDVNKLHLQPKPVQLLLAIVLAAALVGVGYVALFQSQLEELTAAQEKEEQLPL